MQTPLRDQVGENAISSYTFPCTSQALVARRLLDNSDPPLEIPETQEEFAARVMAKIGHNLTDDSTILTIPNHP